VDASLAVDVNSDVQASGRAAWLAGAADQRSITEDAAWLPGSIEPEVVQFDVAGIGRPHPRHEIGDRVTLCL
jgi:hypothetical protein